MWGSLKGTGGRGPTSACRHCTGRLIEAERLAIGLQTVCVVYFGDACVGDKGRPVIGKGKPGGGFERVTIHCVWRIRWVLPMEWERLDATMRGCQALTLLGQSMLHRCADEAWQPAEC